MDGRELKLIRLESLDVFKLKPGQIERQLEELSGVYAYYSVKAAEKKKMLLEVDARIRERKKEVLLRYSDMKQSAKKEALETDGELLKLHQERDRIQSQLELLESIKDACQFMLRTIREYNKRTTIGGI